jgi:hypothetical protein
VLWFFLFMKRSFRLVMLCFFSMYP